MAFASCNFAVSLKCSVSIRQPTRSNTLSLPIWPVNVTVVSVLQFDVSGIASHFLQITDSSSNVTSLLQFEQDNDVTWIVTLIFIKMFSTSFLSISVNSIFRSG